MVNDTKHHYRIPSTSALIAFECAARHLNFSLAAEELSTSQSAISRHIQSIESRFNTLLFDRTKRKHNRLALTPMGEQYYRSVVSSLDGIHNATRALSYASEADQLMIACTHESTHLYLMPRFDELQAHLGPDIQIKIITSEYEALESAPDPRIDLSLKFAAIDSAGRNVRLISQEAIQPICSPSYFSQHKELRSKDIRDWSSLTFLKLTKPSGGGSDWSGWDDLFAYHALDGFEPNYLSYYNYVYLLEAAAAGKGIGLAWRNLIERHLEEGMLVTLAEDYVEFDKGLFGILTHKGLSNPLAEKCLDFLQNMSDHCLVKS